MKKIKCTKCERALDENKIVWLSLDIRTGEYTDKNIPIEFDQGAFPFGKDCANKLTNIE